MSILIGHASIDENGRSSNGQAGDQTGKEVHIGYWYSGNWNVVLRPVSEEIAEKMANACETLCKGNLVGYDQGQRNSLWDELEAVGWDPTKLTAKCETDCSAFMTACARVAGINIPRVFLGNGKYNAPITSTMCNAFCSTGAFQKLTESKYLISDQYLKRGDVLVRESGHTAMALSNGVLFGAAPVVQPSNTIPSVAKPAPSATAIKEVKASGIAYHLDKSLAGLYECTASVLNIRDDSGSGEKVKVLTQIKRGDTVNCYGFYNIVDGVKWLYIQLVNGGITYIAFASSEHLKLKRRF